MSCVGSGAVAVTKSEVSYAVLLDCITKESIPSSLNATLVTFPATKLPDEGFGMYVFPLYVTFSMANAWFPGTVSNDTILPVVVFVIPS